MKTKMILVLMISGSLYSQIEKDQLVIEEKSVFWKDGKDRLILEDGNLYYGEYIKRSGKEITFLREYKDTPDIYLVSGIKLLVLANGKTIVRDRKTYRFFCFIILPFIFYYFSFPLN